MRVFDRESSSCWQVGMFAELHEALAESGNATPPLSPDDMLHSWRE